MLWLRAIIDILISTMMMMSTKLCYAKCRYRVMWLWKVWDRKEFSENVYI
ncbi:hypothetical protein MtrunA17_Chr4g0070421 [Medicago truncatula]|uniref:Uncharacterized protein n=1 Tax=Medicago truncatula TaxID=3880 RepID=A0A396IG86_MEDTR|nr:hypothetical protein MtrunA17_Chr4g0070421 [Medicago truncatula]